LDLKEMAILVIDEKSMIGQDLFRLVDKRLREARPHAYDLPFGGVSVILLGDWKHLPPVCDASLYTNPYRAEDHKKPIEPNKIKDPMGYNLYQLFKDTIIFEKIQRQDGDEEKPFREELQRLGDGKFSRADWEKWKERTRPASTCRATKLHGQWNLSLCAEKRHGAAQHQQG